MLSTLPPYVIYVNVRCKFQALEDMSIEKQTVKERLERELKTLQETSAAKQAELISEYGAKMEIITQDHKQLLEAERSSNEDKLQKLREVFILTLSSITLLNAIFLPCAFFPSLKITHKF